MKNITIMLVLSAILGVIFSYVAGRYFEGSQWGKYLEAYDAYNKAAEELLDTLDSQYNWVDDVAVDSYDYYDSRAKLDSLLGN